MDGLTGIANRRQFDQFLAQLWSLSSRNTEPIALIMCDIDHFKAYNDHYGHLQGDECLNTVLPERLIEAADQALYQAKQTGRNRLVLANDSTPSQNEISFGVSATPTNRTAF